jgi:hypothetical protein
MFLLFICILFPAVSLEKNNNKKKIVLFWLVQWLYTVNMMGILLRYKTPIISMQNFVLKSIKEIKIGIIKKLKLEGNHNVFNPIFNLFSFFLTSFPSFLCFLLPFWLLS